MNAVMLSKGFTAKSQMFVELCSCTNHRGQLQILLQKTLYELSGIFSVCILMYLNQS